MGRANVYLSDALERRVKAARIPVSEVCQQALLAAVEAAESGRPSLGDAVAGAYRQGAQAGERWARATAPAHTADAAARPASRPHPQRSPPRVLVLAQ